MTHLLENRIVRDLPRLLEVNRHQGLVHAVCLVARRVLNPSAMTCAKHKPTGPKCRYKPLLSSRNLKMKTLVVVNSSKKGERRRQCRAFGHPEFDKSNNQMPIHILARSTHFTLFVVTVHTYCCLYIWLHIEETCPPTRGCSPKEDNEANWRTFSMACRSRLAKYITN